ncbi:uncharacterized protein [Cicer arietinum]|uniref:Uncharacterized protein LOC101511308 isoform X1 n=2 Tax=Cicer arietinum TaxID=3827 RepID=A0A1S2Z3C7_CICAR|nr:uncharacterized protein LOC101511308 isoform X1 [Cicer arietinum]XP_004514282.1 uncharacterized protein LOC101511308 isoform X2 [Cicer arietinum]XP_004514283.1 uncharacterized protein LOC101511308 isoform X1 [Cicer arietinum]
MSFTAVFSRVNLLNLPTTNLRCCSTATKPLRLFRCLTFPHRLFANENANAKFPLFFRTRIRCIKQEGEENYVTLKSKDISDTENRFSNEVQTNGKEGHNKWEVPFLAMVVIALGVAVIATLASIGQQPTFGLQILSEGSSSSAVAPVAADFTFKVFGFRVIIPQYAPGWIYFWLLMAAGCGLFISEEALNIWVGTSIARLLSLDGTWQSFVESFSRNASYIISTVLWVYWGVCISDMIPFYLGKLFRKTGASADVTSRLGIGKEKAIEITDVVQKYGNLIGFVERFSLGVRNPTAFLAGALGISPQLFFAGVCCGGLFTLPIQLGIGFLLRERPIFALATVATVVGIWTIFPYAVAAATALFFYVRRKYFS